MSANTPREFDRVLVDIADYADAFSPSVEAVDAARLCLLDTIGCALDALDFHECTKLLGPVVPGTIVPHGSRVPGTGFELDPVTATFSFGCMIRWLDENDTFTAAQGSHPSDNLAGILMLADHWGASAPRKARGRRSCAKCSRPWSRPMRYRAVSRSGRSTIHYTDTTPLAQLGTEPVVFSVRAESSIKAAKELAEHLRSSPESLSFSVGTTVGSHNHIAVAQLAKAVGVNPKPLKVVAFSGSAEGIAALLGGHISVVASPSSGVWEHFVAGKLRVLAVSSESRLGGPLGAVPTWKELGYPVVSANWRSIVGPKDMPDEQARYWDGVFAKLSRLPEWKQALDSEHMENTTRTAVARASSWTSNTKR